MMKSGFTCRLFSLLFLALALDVGATDKGKDTPSFHLLWAPTPTPLPKLPNNNIELVRQIHGPANGGIKALDAVGDYVYLAEGDDFQIVSISDPVNPVLLGRLRLKAPARQIVVQGSYANVTIDDIFNHHGLQVIDIQIPASPVSKSFYNISYPGSLAVRGNLAFLFQASPAPYPFSPFRGVLHIIDLSDPARPKAVNHISEYGGVTLYSLAASSDHKLYFYGREEGMTSIGKGFIGVLDVSALGIENLGDLIYLAGTDGLNIVDLGTTATPRLAWLQRPETRDIELAGNRAVVLYKREAGPNSVPNSIRIFDATNPTSPTLAGAYTLPVLEGPRKLIVSGNMAFVLLHRSVDQQTTSTLQIVDISNPTDARLLGQYIKPVLVNDFAVSENLMGLALDDSVEFIDISNPATPTSLSDLSILNDHRHQVITNIAVSGSIALITDGLNLHIIDIKNPTAPYLRGVAGIYVYFGLHFVSGPFALRAPRPGWPEAGLEYPSLISVIRIIPFSWAATGP